MFSHVMLGSNDLHRSKKFYDATLGALGLAEGAISGNRVYWRTKTGVFAVTIPLDGKAATPANGGTLGFACSSAEQVEAWHAAGVANGGTSIEDPPGIRQGATGKMMLAYLRDPDGNKICALYRIPAA